VVVVLLLEIVSAALISTELVAEVASGAGTIVEIIVGVSGASELVEITEADVSTLTMV
jgi:hypothetical protein